MTAYRLVPVTAPDLEYVVEHLWERGRQELHQMHIQLSTAFNAAWQWSRPETFRSGILLADDVPIVATGIAVDDTGAFTWFLATEAALDHMPEVTRMLRRELRAWGGPVRLRSASVHPETHRWFRVLGFRHERDEGAIHIYRRE